MRWVLSNRADPRADAEDAGGREPGRDALQQAIDESVAEFREHVELTGAISPCSSWYWEFESIVEDAVVRGFQAAQPASAPAVEPREDGTPTEEDFKQVAKHVDGWPALGRVLETARMIDNWAPMAMKIRRLERELWPEEFEFRDEVARLRARLDAAEGAMEETQAALSEIGNVAVGFVLSGPKKHKETWERIARLVGDGSNALDSVRFAAATDREPGSPEGDAP